MKKLPNPNKLLKFEDWCYGVGSSVIRFGDFLHFGQLLKPLAAINLPKSPTFLGKFCEGVKIFHFSCEIIFG